MEKDKNITISKEQYLEILNRFEKYIKTYQQVLGKEMSMEYSEGLLRGLDLIQTMVKK